MPVHSACGMGCCSHWLITLPLLSSIFKALPVGQRLTKPRSLLACLSAATHTHRFDGSTLGAATPTSNNKVWWSQVESLQAFDWLQKQPGSADYKTKFQQTLAFITNNLWDQQYGELYWQVGRGGGPPLPFEAADRPFPGTNKGNAWKTSYHTGRAFLRLLQAGYA